VRAIAPTGNLFLLLIVEELRRLRLTYAAFYVLQRAIDAGTEGISIASLRSLTGLPNYELSRACKVLATAKLGDIRKHERDRRIRVLRSTDRGETVHGQILSVAAKRFQQAFREIGDKRRIDEAADFSRQGNRKLIDPMRLSFFDRYDPETGAALYPEE
jgi:DNA-binding MarR family transcriptional regulator